MRKIGLIGGMSWVSTELYYRRINTQIARRVGALSSAPIVMESLNFAEVARTETEEDWGKVAKSLSASAKRLQRAGATAILICANSMHKLYDEVTEGLKVPVIHIADCVGERMEADGIETAALLGTRNVMTEPFYRQRLVEHGITLLPPDMQRVQEVDRIIYEELMMGRATRDAERTLKTFITNIDKQGVEAVVLGCTELNMVVHSKANILPIYDSTEIHADAAVDWILADEQEGDASQDDEAPADDDAAEGEEAEAEDTPAEAKKAAAN